ncbi:MAG: VOC family protein [Cytophagaceae bacterium]|jgi:catechol 2,3-dioxygenase-like lactoylglutathione lyase family enzyme|uniref:VOC family protein n=1 Tax=Flavobacterium sp. TaxID=239 RepID=UPI001B4053D4|nr:VOC family protein [Flavobacterium sp.]MBP6094620.1 VOC family protein [Cytophagaceae bacterium]
MNLCTENVARTSEFYQSVFNLSRLQDEEHNLVSEDTEDRFDGVVDFLTDGEVEFHITKKDVNLGFEMKHFINPLERGHFCFRTDDIEGFKKRLEEKGIPYADYGKWALAGWYQIFFHDPDGNIIEVHQIGM